ncbi:MAG: purine-nucleoside phosphorylase, partial [Thermoanaerobaculia bacterium]
MQETTAAVRARWEGEAAAALVLGTGLSGVAEAMEVDAAFDFAELPHFPVSTALSHHGRLLCGRLAGRPVVATQGRVHVYEGYPPWQVAFPVRVMRALGAELLLVSQAVGGLNPLYRPGDPMIIEDHVNLMGVNPLVGPNDERLGPRFPDMSRPYDPELIDVARAVARRGDFTAHVGVTVAVAGPNLETRAEYRFLRALGADVVGMSTVPETLVAVHGGMRVFGVSVVTDMCLPDALEPADATEIVRVAQ